MTQRLFRFALQLTRTSVPERRTVQSAGPKAQRRFSGKATSHSDTVGQRDRACSLPVNLFEVVNKMKVHVKARCEVYPGSDVKRFKVPDDKVPWDVEFPEYKPVDFTAPSILKKPLQPWADIDIREKDENSSTDVQPPKWNARDGKINRTSFMGKYKIVDGVPRNPEGRTGMTGRGRLGRWGPNHAADPIVTRWKTDQSGNIIQNKEGKNVAEFIAVKRRDNGQWALPGGMVDVGEVVTTTLRREFGEEALNSLQASEGDKKRIESSINHLFADGNEIYRGYVDDPRNTDNAWMETLAMNFHDGEGKGVALFKLNAGDDAVGVQWMELSHKLELYASHIDFLEKTAEKLNASW